MASITQPTKPQETGGKSASIHPWRGKSFTAEHVIGGFYVREEDGFWSVWEVMLNGIALDRAYADTREKAIAEAVQLEGAEPVEMTSEGLFRDGVPACEGRS